MSIAFIFTSQPCPVCQKVSTVELDYAAAVAWRNGMHVQDAFPDMPMDEREILITGTHPACWDILFPEEEDE